MKKIFKILVFVLVIFCLTGCKTTDRLDSNESEIKKLNELIEQLKSDYETKISELEGKHQNQETEISDVNSSIGEMKQDYDAQFESKAADIEATNTSIAELKSNYDAKLLLIENDANTKKLVLENLIAQNTNLINQYKSELDGNITTAKSDTLSIINAMKTDYDSRVIDINREIEANSLALANLDTKFAEDLEEISGAIELSQEEVESQIAKLTQKHNEDVAELNQKNTTLNNSLISLQTELETKVAAINTSLETMISTLQTEYNSKIALLQTQITNNQNSITELNTKLVADVAAAKAELNNALLALKEEINGDIDELEELIETNQQDIATINELIENCPPGASAYEIFKKYYPSYVGSEQDWLNDLINCRLKTDIDEEEWLPYFSIEVRINGSGYADGYLNTGGNGGPGFYYGGQSSTPARAFGSQPSVYMIKDGILYIKYYLNGDLDNVRIDIIQGCAWKILAY